MQILYYAMVFIDVFLYNFRTESSAENSSVSQDTSCASDHPDKKVKPTVPPKPSLKPPAPTTTAITTSAAAENLLQLPRQIQRSQSQPESRLHQHQHVLRHANSQDSPVGPSPQGSHSRPNLLTLKHSHSVQEPDIRSRVSCTKNGPLPPAGGITSPGGAAVNKSILSTLDRLRPSCRTNRMQQLHISLDQLSLQHQQVRIFILSIGRLKMDLYGKSKHLFEFFLDCLSPWHRQVH